MRIAVTADPYLPVPPQYYGGIERIVDIVVRGLVAKGHKVTLFGHPGSSVPCTLVPYGTPPYTGLRRRLKDLSQLAYHLWRHRNTHDIVINWGRLAALTPLLRIRSLPKIQRYCRAAVPWRSVRIASRMAAGSLQFVGASHSVYRHNTGSATGVWHTIYDCVELSRYTPVRLVRADAPLVFLGRLERIKGTHHAIEIARRSGQRLIIAGNTVSSPEAQMYYSREIAPHIDGKRVEYVGPVTDAQKNQILGRAKGLLMPIACNEAFGIVMAEAMACGTPVIGFACGSVPEVVINGTNGFVCRNVEEAVTAVGRLSTIDRLAVRSTCEGRFSAAVIVDAYEELCRKMIGASQKCGR
jgi:glycosyltransferase involved in cell wall biosynthesis